MRSSEIVPKRIDKHKGANTNWKGYKISFSDSWEHFEGWADIIILKVHLLSKFKIEKSNLVIGEMRSKLNWDLLASIRAMPFWMMIFFFTEFAYSLDEGLSLFKTIKFKCFGKSIKVITIIPSLNTTSFDNISDLGLIHLLEFINTSFIECSELGFEFPKVCLCHREAFLKFLRSISFGLKRNKECWLSSNCIWEYLSGNSSRYNLCQHFY